MIRSNLKYYSESFKNIVKLFQIHSNPFIKIIFKFHSYKKMETFKNTKRHNAKKLSLLDD